MILGDKVYGLRVNISQWRYTSPNGTHENAYDWAGDDTGISQMICPDGQVIKCIDFKRDGSGVGYSFYEFQNPVTLASGKVINKLQMMCLHGQAADVRGTIYKAGQAFYEEGTAGHATGNHVHLEFGTGYNGLSDYFLKKGKNEWVANFDTFINMEDIFYFTKDVKLTAPSGAKFKTSDYKKEHYYFKISSDISKYNTDYDFVLTNTNTWNKGVVELYSEVKKGILATHVGTLKKGESILSRAYGWSGYYNDDIRYYIHQGIYNGKVVYFSYKRSEKE